ncbi:AlpA family transcriptional regulator [Arthrobacter sp. GMC3]|uniref:helix-turn-helix transcriptional regulator n=1 Tax=Arthrobacter sp. GMC3 TaxID=2058894 RepID=UPI000CE489D7|nr:helix-turn-helix domain-containing protein [Arthrobacter sp. GMC3]
MPVLTAPAIDFLTTNDVADLIATSSRHVRQMRVNGTGPAFVSIGPRTVRYERPAVDAWLQAKGLGQKPEFEPPEPALGAGVAEAPPCLFDDLADSVQRVVAKAPPLTPEQRERLAVILGGASR